MQKRVWRNISICVVACLLSIVGIGVFSPPASAAPCTDIKFFGLRGSGQLPVSSMGKEVANTFSKFKAEVKKKGYSVSSEPIAYNAPDLLTQKAQILAALPNARDGAKKLKQALNRAVKACPNQHFVVSGYSLGSWGVHIAVGKHTPATGERLSDKARGRIKAVVIYGSPHFDPDDQYAHGDIDGRLKGVAGARKLASLPHAVTYCRGGDPICNSNVRNFDKCIKGGWSERTCPHQQYGSGITGTQGEWLAGLFSSRSTQTNPVTINTIWAVDKNRTPQNVWECGIGELIGYWVTVKNGSSRTVHARVEYRIVGFTRHDQIWGGVIPDIALPPGETTWGVNGGNIVSTAIPRQDYAIKVTATVNGISHTKEGYFYLDC